MMGVDRAQAHWNALALLAVASLAPPALADPGWLPVISDAEAATVELSSSALEQGWYPVLINPPKKDERSRRPASTSTPAATATVEAGDAPAPRQRPAQKQTQARPKQAAEPAPQEAPELNVAPPKGSLAESYCASIADAAADARFAWQKRTLSEMEKELERRIVILEERTAEYRRWLERRDAFVEKARESLVRIYARMRPDAAASQFAAMDEETAAAVLTKLKPRVASAILNEMPPGPAARLSMIIAGAAKVPPEDEPRPLAGGGRS